MNISTTEQIILVILSLTLAIFLTVSIIATIKVIQILDHLKKITIKAESIADKAESVTTFFQNTTGHVALGKLLSNIFNASREHKTGKKD